MKNISILLLILFVACKSNQTIVVEDSSMDLTPEIKTHDLVVDDFPIDSISESEFRTADSVAFVSPYTSVVDDSTRVFPDSLKIVFKLDNGVDSVLVNEWDEDGDGNRVFHYVQSCKDFDYWVVLVSYYEGSEFLLMDKKDGSKKYIWGQPVISPDNKRFISYSCDIDAGYNYNGIQLFEINGRKADLKWQKEIGLWGPDEVRWKDVNTLYIKKYSNNYRKGNAVQKYSFGSVKIQDLK